VCLVVEVCLISINLNGADVESKDDDLEEAPEAS